MAGAEGGIGRGEGRRAERPQRAHLAGPPGPSEEWGLICKIALTCCSAKFLHFTLGVGDLSLSVHINALYFLKIAEIAIV